MLRKPNPRLYTEFDEEEDADEEEDGDDEEGENQAPGFFSDPTKDLEPEDPNSSISQEDEIRGSNSSIRFSKVCVKNFFTVVLILIYLLLTGGAAFLVYKTIADFLDKLNHPVMSVTYKEIDMFDPPGIALYTGGAQLLSCRHHYHNYIPPLVDPGKPQEGDCVIKEVTYTGPFTNHTNKTALVVRGPSDVSNKELIFMQFSHNETEEDFSAITYMLFYKFKDLINSTNQSAFMRDCERNYSTWTFSGGFRTWVKMSLVRTSGKSRDSVEFHQESSVVKFNDKRPGPEQTNQLFFVVFEWRDPYIQEIRLIVAANPWSAAAILCGVLLALFKAAHFFKLTIAWIIRMRRRILKNRARELNQIN